MYTNADITLYLYSKAGTEVKYTRLPVQDVFWDDVRQSTFLKTGQTDAVSVLIVVPLSSLEKPLTFTEGRDLVIRGIVDDEIECLSDKALSESLAALKATHSYVTVVSADDKLYGSEEVQHYELSCR